MKTEQLINQYIAKGADARIGQLCDCGRRNRSTRCRDCFQLAPLCNDCFLACHTHHPFHWAEHWCLVDGFFRCHDLSTLDTEWAIHLGHDSAMCPHAIDSNLLNVVDSNGVHATRVCYCRCTGRPAKWDQLFTVNLFPGLVSDPGTAYTFRALREFQLHSETSKKHAYDYCRALAQLTDYHFSHTLPEFYTNFLTITRLWAFVRANKWTGQGHGIDKLLPHRPSGNLTVVCPTCPEENVNMEEGWDTTPLALRHLYSCR